MKKLKHVLMLSLLIALGFWAKNLLLASDTTVSNHKPVVVATIPPFYALLKPIMEGIAVPTLLMNPAASPHDYVLKPSEVQLLKNADIIFWGGPDLESFLIKALNNLSSENSRVVELSKTPNLHLLEQRVSAEFEPHDHAHDHHAPHHTHEHSTVDMHFWLDPINALLLIDSMVKHLSHFDPLHAKQYQTNGNLLKNRLRILDQDITKKLKSFQTKSFIVFHDAYQYFEKHYGLKASGSITINPEIPPSAKHLQALREKIEKAQAACVFKEPQFSSKLVEKLITGTHAKMGVLDPIGVTSDMRPKTYEALLNDLADGFVECFKK